MGPYSSAQTMFWVSKIEKWKNESPCDIRLERASVKNGSSCDYSPERASIMVLCLMSPIGKIHLLPSLVQCWTCCANPEWEWLSEFVFMYWLVVSWSVFVLSMITVIYWKIRNGSLVKGKERNSELYWISIMLGFFFFPRDDILCKNVYLYPFVVVALMSSFLTSSFPTEPLN